VLTFFSAAVCVVESAERLARERRGFNFKREKIKRADSHSILG
jgi:hypothetical protein